ncbi:MAG TPA: preprotein translocase subunit SecE [Pilimelia sp.]|nr:preprotein translocase subunit SecE [Pilimelia sp.]
MAENKRRDEDAADDRDEVFDDVVDDDAAEPVSGGGGTATLSRPKAADERPVRTKGDTERVGFFGRIGRFIREVVAELRKVIWPTRKELLTYTTVVIVFLTVMAAIVVALDYVFAEGVLRVFGDPD